jgi:hypothetical protein
MPYGVHRGQFTLDVSADGGIGAQGFQAPL